MNIEKIVMILNHHTIDIEHRMMMLALIYLYIKMLSEKIVSPLLCADSCDYSVSHSLLLEKPYIDIAARTMIRDRIVKTQTIALENHHSNPMLGEKSRQLRNHTLLPCILPLHLLGRQRPLNPICLRWLLIHLDLPTHHRMLDIIPYYRRDVMITCKMVINKSLNTTFHKLKTAESRN